MSILDWFRRTYPQPTTVTLTAEQAEQYRRAVEISDKVKATLQEPIEGTPTTREAMVETLRMAALCGDLHPVERKRILWLIESIERGDDVAKVLTDEAPVVPYAADLLDLQPFTDVLAEIDRRKRVVGGGEQAAYDAASRLLRAAFAQYVPEETS